MFHLESEIKAWCRSVHAGGWGRSARAEELEDHLYCEVERLQEDGLSQEEAFAVAIEGMGNIEDLVMEHAKNQSVLLASCEGVKSRFAALEGMRRSMTPKKAALLTILLSLAFAGAMMLSSFLMKGSPYEQHSDTVTYLLIAVWWVPFSLLSTAGSKSCKKKKVAGR